MELVAAKRSGVAKVVGVDCSAVGHSEVEAELIAVGCRLQRSGVEAELIAVDCRLQRSEVKRS